MAKGFFVTGSDTGVGKTIITAALIRAANIIGLRVCGMKPIETGCKKTGTRTRSSEDGKEILLPSDGMFLREAAGMSDSLDLVTPLRFESPLAPLPASEMEGRPVDLDKVRKSFAHLSERYDAVIAEGLGGLLAPIKRGYFVLDLARDLGLPLVVVSRPSLGTINHTLLTVNYAMREGLTVAGIILNYTTPPKNDLAEKSNPEVIQQLSPVPFIGIFPHLQDLGNKTLENAVIENLDMGIIKKYL